MQWCKCLCNTRVLVSFPTSTVYDLVRELYTNMLVMSLRHHCSSAVRARGAGRMLDKPLDRQNLELRDVQ